MELLCFLYPIIPQRDQLLWSLLPSVLGCIILVIQERYGRLHPESYSAWHPEVAALESTVSAEVFYESAVQLVIHSEGISWNRLYYYLVAASILVLAWTQVYSQPRLLGGGVLVITALIGMIISLWWAPFGNRGRRYLHRFIDYANWVDRFSHGPLSVGRMTSFRRIERWSRSGLIVVGVPLLFAFVFSFMLILSFEKACRNDVPWPSTVESPRAIIGLP